MSGHLELRVRYPCQAGGATPQLKRSSVGSRMKALSLFLLVTFLISCRGRELSTGGATVVDSAGIVIVTNALPTDSLPEWTIAGDPITQVGT